MRVRSARSAACACAGARWLSSPLDACCCEALSLAISRCTSRAISRWSCGALCCRRGIVPPPPPPPPVLVPSPVPVLQVLASRPHSAPPMSLRSPIRPLSPHSRGLLGAIASSVPQPPARGLRRRSELESVAATSRHRCFLARRDTARRPRVRRMAQQMSRAARCLRTACSRLRKDAAFAAEA